MPTSLYFYIFFVLLISVSIFRDYLSDHNVFEVKNEYELGVYGMFMLVIICLGSLIYGGFVWW